MKNFLKILFALVLISAVAADSLKFSDFAVRGTLPGNGFTVGYIDSTNGLKYNVRYPNSVLQGKLVAGTGITLVGNVISAPGGGGSTGPIDTTSGAGGINQANFRAFIANNTPSVDHMFDQNSFDANPDGSLDLWGHNRYPSTGTSISNLTVTLSGTSSYNAGVLILNTGSSAATIGAKTVFATINFVPNWPILPGSVTYSLEGDDAAQYLGSGNLVYTGAMSTANCTIKLLNSSTIPANKTLYVHFKFMPGSNASGQ